MKWMILPYKRYFDFSGRSSRKEYWMFHLFLLVFLVGMIFILDSVERDLKYGAISDYGFGLFGIIILASIIPHVAVTIRRYHDQSLSGWYYLWTFFPYIGGLISIYFMVQEGTPDENQWGPDPLQDGIDTEIFA